MALQPKEWTDRERIEAAAQILRRATQAGSFFRLREIEAACVVLTGRHEFLNSILLELEREGVR